MNFNFHHHRRLRWINLPGAMLMVLLQRTPALSLLGATEEIVIASPVGTVLKSIAASVAALGAVNTLVGATPLVPSTGTASGITLAVGSSVNVFYTVNGTQTPPMSWHITGTVPPGLNFSGLTSSGSVNAGSLNLAGTPTTAGNYPVTLQTFEFANTGGIGSPVYNYTITVTGSVANSAPVFSTQPSGETVTAGQSVSFTAVATGTPAPTFQWQKGNVAINGATNSSFSIASVAAGDAGDYTVVATNSVSSVTSNIATLTVSAAATAPTFTIQPSSQTITAGQSVTFNATAAGNPTPTYQWQMGGVTIGGAIRDTFSIPNVVPGDAGNYTAVATNSAGSTTSSVATLTVSAVATAPSFATQPNSQTVAAGNSVTLSAVANGSPSPTYQWYKDGVALNGAATTVYAIAHATLANAGTYQVVAVNMAGSITSNEAILTVRDVPAITTQPLSSVVFAGGSVTFIVGASGTPAPTYQWQKNGINVTGATGATLALTNIQVADAGSYALVVTNSGGSSTSRFARLVVLVPQANATVYTATAYPTGVTAGGNVGLDYTLTNIGTRNWGVDHYLSVRDSNGTFMAFSPLTGTQSGENKTVHASFTAPTTAGTYTYIVQGLESGVEFFSSQTTFTLTVLAPQPNSITYNTTNFPVSATPGSNLIFNYNVTNTGTKSWGTNHFLSVRNSAGAYAQFVSLNGVMSGQSKTVNLSVTAPAAPGVYPYYVQALESGVEFFTAQVNLTLAVLGAHPNAVIYTPTRSQDNVTPGATVNLRYSLSNAGTETWGMSHYASLRDSNGNFLAFVPLSGVAPGENTTVNFNFTAPTTPGIYSYYVQNLEDGVEFFDSQDVATLTVLATPIGNAATYNTSTFPASTARGATVTFSENVSNHGTTTWGANHYLSFRDADNIFLGFLAISGVASGQSRTLTFTFTAPSAPGVYTYHVQGFESGIEFFNMSDNLVLIVP